MSSKQSSAETYRSAPTRVCRSGGAVRVFEDPRRVWKKAHLPDRECIVELVVPPGNRIVYPEKPSHAWNSPKIRVSKARVLNIEELSGGDVPEATAEAPHVKGFWYTIGKSVVPSGLSDDVETVDGEGIHCFATREGARWWGKQDFDPTRVSITGKRAMKADAGGSR